MEARRAQRAVTSPWRGPWLSRWLGPWLALGLAVWASCGPEQVFIDTSRGAYACDAISGSGAHICRETSWAGGAYASTQWAEDCMMNLGRQVATCALASAVGGCRTTTNVTSPDGRGIQITDTWWFYSGRVETLKANCVGDWVAP